MKGRFIRVEGKQDTAEEKIRRLNEAGISVAEEISQSTLPQNRLPIDAETRVDKLIELRCRCLSRRGARLRPPIASREGGSSSGTS